MPFTIPPLDFSSPSSSYAGSPFNDLGPFTNQPTTGNFTVGSGSAGNAHPMTIYILAALAGVAILALGKSKKG